MPNVNEIKTKISSIQSTQKITKAMEMVAVSKMRKSQDRMSASRPYSSTIRQVIGHLASANLDVSNPYFEERPIKRVGYLIVSTDRGLCGGLNINLFRKILTELREWNDKSVEVDRAVFGSKGIAFFNSVGANIITQVTQIGDTPSLIDVVGPVKTLVEAFAKGNVDRLFIANNQFVNTMTQNPQIQQLLPIPPLSEEYMKGRSWDYLYEPNAEVLIRELLKRYIESQVYQGIVENMASEQAARMVAMKAATDNGGNIIKELQIVYNKIRQGAITNELIDIVSGASAVSD